MTYVDRIIGEYKEALKRREQEKEVKRQKEKQKRELNAEAIEDCIRKIIEPVFNNVKMQIIKNGFLCEIELISKKGPDLSAEKTFAIGIKLLTRTAAQDFPGNKSHLQYEGNFETQEIVTSERIAMCGPFTESDPVPLSRINSDLINEDLEQFLSKVFTACKD